VTNHNDSGLHRHPTTVRGFAETVNWDLRDPDFFAAESRKALEHAYKFGQKIVALGGVPTVEVGAMVRQSLDLEEMVPQDLELEREALQAYLEAWTLAGDDVALRTMLEEHIATEQRDIEELEMYLSMVHTEALVSAG
jgi:bacterioferritin (cytochrome b1)